MKYKKLNPRFSGAPASIHVILLCVRPHHLSVSFSILNVNSILDSYSPIE
jgi:hypothetical protein